MDINKRLLKYFFIIVHFGLFYPIIKIFIAILGGIKIITSIAKHKERKFILSPFTKSLSLVYFYYVVYSIFCFLIILYLFPYSGVFPRFVTQQFSMGLLFFQIYLGYQIALKLEPIEINKIFQKIIYFISFIAIYQIIANYTGLPYIGKYVMDSNFGLRISSLSGEPKHFSSILVLAIFSLKDRIMNDITKHKFYLTIFLILLIYLFLRTGSGNGYLSLFIITIMSIYLWRPKLLLIACLIFSVGILWFLNNYEIFNLRASHVMIIESIKSFKLSLLVWDDLVALPLMSWIKYPFFLVSGFGFNLNHFFAYEFMNYATWLDGIKYIDSNISIISIISNFGVILPITLFIYITNSTQKILKTQASDEVKLMVRFAYYTFTIGLFVAGNVSILFFGSIGILLYFIRYYKNQRLLKSEI
ncbi:MAG: hypothetical protein WC384_16050 [Prolixibacteraceae bacterium]|jgi:hypothetical protein